MSPLPTREEMVDRIIAVAAAYYMHLTVEQAIATWEAYSDSMCASWLLFYDLAWDGVETNSGDFEILMAIHRFSPFSQ